MSPSTPPPTKQNTENCAEGDNAIGFRDGAIVQQSLERLQLEIMDIKPRRVFPMELKSQSPSDWRM
jgi:hypothetical protein